MGELGDEVDHGQPGQHAVGAQQLQCAERVRGPPAERTAPLVPQRFRQHQQSIDRIDEAESGGRPERQPRIDIAQQSAGRRAEHEAGAERRSHAAEDRGAPLWRREVGDVGKGRGNAGRGDAGDQPANEQPRQRRRHRHQHIVRGEAEVREQDDRPPAEPVGEAAEHRREHELHQCPGRAEQAEDPCCLRGVIGDKALDQLGQDRHDQPEREHIEQDGDEDESDGAAARGLRRRYAVGTRQLGVDHGLPSGDRPQPRGTNADLYTRGRGRQCGGLRRQAVT